MPEAGRTTLFGEDCCAFIEDAYATALGGVGTSEPLRLEHRRRGLGSTGSSIDEFAFSGSFDYHAAPVDVWRVTSATAGTIRLRVGAREHAASAGEAFTTVPGTDFTGTNLGLDATIVNIDLDVVRRILGPEVDARRAVSFDNVRTISGAAQQAWDATVDYVLKVALSPPFAAAAPLVVDQAERMLASTALALFAVDRRIGRELDTTDATPAAVRRAVAFAETNAAGDIGVAEMAAAARITPRALQYAFRRHLATSPEAWLRSLRLDCAHRDLLAADADATTVAAIAGHWGFYHAGRFAAAYRERYGSSPHRTLRS